ncbi:MAG TPA: hypothetical protein VGT61_11385 [Thermomicrobiales bacterium]|jgi:hypothetical protein|nr:hypothetical protein [Thermomicrobiales bacterium]
MEREEGTPRIEIAGEVSDDERDAIVASLAVLVLRHGRISEPVVASQGRWARTARREGVRVDQPTWRIRGQG